MDSLKQPTQQKMGTRIGTWNVKYLYGAGSHKTVSDNGNGNANHHLGIGFLVHQRNRLAAIKRVELVSDRTSYMIQRDY
jgi:hypothetical protein